MKEFITEDYEMVFKEKREIVTNIVCDQCKKKIRTRWDRKHENRICNLFVVEGLTWIDDFGLSHYGCSSEICSVKCLNEYLPKITPECIDNGDTIKIRRINEFIVKEEEND